MLYYKANGKKEIKHTKSAMLTTTVEASEALPDATTPTAL